VSESEQSTLAELIDALPDDLRRQALTHSSWVDEDGGASYERLAFLGDSVLALAVAHNLFEGFPEADSGALTRIRNQAVSGVSCAEVGRELGVPQMLIDAEPEKEDVIPADVLLAGARPLPEATEALIGACYIAFGYERTAAAITSAFQARIQHAVETRTDFKSALQELAARRKTEVFYNVITEAGPAHQRSFEVEAIVGSERVGWGEGRSKKAAEQAAAEQALKRLDG
jgi:ribonuclease-3